MPFSKNVVYILSGKRKDITAICVDIHGHVRHLRSYMLRYNKINIFSKKARTKKRQSGYGTSRNVRGMIWEDKFTIVGHSYYKLML